MARSGWGVSLSLCWARRKPGAGNVHDRNVSKSFLLLGTRFANGGRLRSSYCCSHFAQRHRPITFTAEGLRLALYSASTAESRFIRIQPVRSAACRVSVRYFATYHPLLVASV